MNNLSLLVSLSFRELEIGALEAIKEGLEAVIAGYQVLDSLYPHTAEVPLVESYQAELAAVEEDLKEMMR